MLQGKLLSSSTVMALLKKKVAAEVAGRWVLLDGFPRSRDNCEDFFAVCGAPEFVLNIEVPDDVMVERILKRGESSGRADDNADTAQRRIETFHAEREPTLQYLLEHGIPVHTLDGTTSPDMVWLQQLECDTPLRRMVR
jgi:adenylate kinase family enzyme